MLSSEGRWALLSFYKTQTIVNGEYLPQIGGYVELLTTLGYPSEQVLFEPGDAYERIDLAVLSPTGDVLTLGEAKVDPSQPDDLIHRILNSYADCAPTETDRPPKKDRQYEAWKLARAIWKFRPTYLWLLAPGVRQAYECTWSPLRLHHLPGLPACGPRHEGDRLA